MPCTGAASILASMEMSVADRLDRRAWLEAGLELLAEEGVDAVRVTDLAARLHVTKGSFYWHFRDRADFLDALLETWGATRTDAIIAAVDAKGGEAKTRLRTLFLKSFNSDGRLFLAIQGWARRDDRVQAALNRVVRRRIVYVEQLFLDFGFRPSEAAARAEFAFQALIGHYALGAASMFAGKDKRRRFEIIFGLLTRAPA